MSIKLWCNVKILFMYYYRCYSCIKKTPNIKLQGRKGREKIVDYKCKITCLNFNVEFREQIVLYTLKIHMY